MLLESQAVGPFMKNGFVVACEQSAGYATLHASTFYYGPDHHGTPVFQLLDTNMQLLASLSGVGQAHVCAESSGANAHRNCSSALDCPIASNTGRRSCLEVSNSEWRLPVRSPIVREFCLRTSRRET